MHIRISWPALTFFTVEVLSWRGLVTYYVLFFLHLESRRVSVAGITRHPDQAWMEPIARSATQETWGYLDGCRYVLQDRDTKFCASFRSVLAAGGVKTMALPARSPNLNTFAERWVRSAKEECLSKLILFGEGPLSRTATPLSVASGSENCSSSMPAPHEFFDHSASSEKLACSVGDSPTGGKVRDPVAWVAFVEETKRMKPTDKAILGMVSESPGRNASEPRSGLDKKK